MASKNFSDTDFLDTPCYFSKAGLYIMPSFTVVWGFILFPLSSLVLHIGFQKWRQNRRSTISHTDFFTYNTLVFNLINSSGFAIYSIASLQSNHALIKVALMFTIFAASGQQAFHVLTCVERYLAVLHPVVYVSLKNQKWIWVRNVIVFAVWVFFLAWTALVLLINTSVTHLTLLSVVISIITFCSVQVLRALTNPSPGEGSGASQSKRRAFYTMIVILSALTVWLSSKIAVIVVEKAHLLEGDELCKFQKAFCFLELPSSLVLPLLFLHRAWKLPKCRGRNVQVRRRDAELH